MPRLIGDAQECGADTMALVETGICQSRNRAAVYEHLEVSKIECCRNGRGRCIAMARRVEAVL